MSFSTAAKVRVQSGAALVMPPGVLQSTHGQHMQHVAHRVLPPGGVHKEFGTEFSIGLASTATLGLHSQSAVATRRTQPL